MPFIANDSRRNAQKLREILSTFEAMDITVARDHVVICGQIVHRPSRLPRSQWLAHWDILA